MNNQNFNILNWFSKTISDGISKAVSNVISYFLTLVFFGMLGILLIVISSELQKTIVIPVYIIVILSMFSLIGIIIPAKSMINIIKNSRKVSKKPRVIAVNFENSHRSWKALCKYNSNRLTWDIGDPNPYCTIHNLKLNLDSKDNDFNLLVYSMCPDCKTENISYFTDQDCILGVFPHYYGLKSGFDYDNFINSIRNRILREVESNRD